LGGRYSAHCADPPKARPTQVFLMPSEHVWQNGGIATMRADSGPYGAIPDGVVAASNGRLDWVGFRKAMPPTLIGPATQVHDLQGGWLTPGLIDCHTHLVFAGERSAEFEARLGGTSYESAARAGGGIRATMAATRAATQQELVALATPRLRRLMAEGVTTVEIKSGYGLTLEDELKMLRAARQLGAENGIRVRTTLLAAHAVPPEYEGNADAYIDHVVHVILPAAAAENLADAVDGFAEDVAFNRTQISRVFAAAQDYDLPVKLHADQLTDGRGAALAARFNALSADHLEYTSATGVREMAEAGTVAVLLPGAYATVGATQPPPVALFRKHEVDMAVATDLNPGSSPLNSLLMAMNLACCLFRLTPEEALAGVTRNAARALGLQHETGTLDEGKAADIAIWPVKHPRELAYWMGGLSPAP
jgi:imidazolonepropionase